MPIPRIGLLALSVVASLVACSEQQAQELGDEAREVGAVLGEAASDAGAALSEAAGAAGQKVGAWWEESASERAELEGSLRAALDDATTRLGALSEQAAALGGDAKVRLEEAMGVLEAHRDDLEGRLSGVRSATSETWERLRREAREALQDARGLLEQVQGDSER